MKQEQSRQRGATLLFSVAILALLALFSVVFARLMNLERRASAYYTDRVRAKLAARAGIERAIVELQKIAGTKHYSDPWGDGWGYQLTAPPQLGTRPLDLQTTTTPSFVETETGASARQRLGTGMSYSGVLGIPYKGSVLAYRLKILDAASQVNLNHRDGAAAQRMLRSLLRAELGISSARAAAIAARVIPDLREVPTRFRSKPQIGHLLTDPNAPATTRITEAEYLYQIRDKITVHSWEDSNTVRPWNLNGTGQHRLALMPRAPININTASRPVLIALFAEASAQTRYGTFTAPFVMAERLADAIIARRRGPDSGAYSGTTSFRPFRSWKEFERWVDGGNPTDACPATVFAAGTGAVTDTNPGTPNGPTAWPGGVTWAPADGFYVRMQNLHRVAHRDLVKAICNPNTMANKFGMMVNHGGWKGKLPRMVDKTDMVALTTEACFDSMGVFEITSAGMILLEDEQNVDVGYEILAAHTDQMVIQVYTPYRLTTQHDFEKHRAFMVPGNFINSPEATTPQVFTTATNQAFAVSTNLPGFFGPSDGGVDNDYGGNPMPMAGWPGLVTWPQYSVDRASALDHQPKPEYAMASWDGYMTLSNMITVRTGDPDFVTGFSRGKLEAFKARAWWEPRDRKAIGPPKVNTPTRPAAGTGELQYLAKPLGGEPLGAPGGSGTSQTVRVRSAINAGEASVIGEDFSDTTSGPPTNPVELWTKGSQLYNTGVLIAPDRVNDNGDPLFLAYDSNNLDLVRGSSIRFWVQPLRDPYAQNEEVLFSFVGSNGAAPGNAVSGASPGDDGSRKAGLLRQAGFRVYKEKNPDGKIYIVLQAYGQDDTESANGVDYEWAAAVSGHNATPTLGRTRIDVTPKPMNGPLTEPEMNPKNPEWIPGTWHWVVINIGPGTRASDGSRHAFATIQVDKSDPSPSIVYRGDWWGTAVPQTLGEVNLYDDKGGTLIGVVTKNNATDPTVRHLVHPRHLGDYYHCQQHNQASKVGAPASAGQPTDHGLGVVSVAREREYCTPGKAPSAIRFNPVRILPWFPWDASGLKAQQYETTAYFPVAPFPILSYNQRMFVRFYDATTGNRAIGNNGAQVPDLEMTHDITTDRWNVPWPKLKSNVYGIDPDPGSPPASGPINGQDYNTGPGSGYPNNPSGYPGGHEWHMAIYTTWEEAHYLASSKWGNTEPPASTPRLVLSNGAECWLPADLTTLYSVDEPFQLERGPDTPFSSVVVPADPIPADYETNGESLPYSVHNSGRTTKGGQPYGQSASELSLPSDPDTNFKRSYVRTKVGLPNGTGAGRRFTQLGATIPLDYVDDDCHGCEDCDLDGPIFIGGEPPRKADFTFQNNYIGTGAGSTLTPVDKSTMAYAVFDNIVFLNNDPTRRTDVPSTSVTTPDLFEPGSGPGTIPPVNLELKNFEDRFFEEDLAQYLVARGDPKGTGAIYHRGLLELRNTQVRLGSMTWTSYPTNSPTGNPIDSLDYEVAVWKVPNIIDTSAGTQTYNYNSNVLAGREDNPDWGDPASASKFASDPTVGITFSEPGDPPTGFVNTKAYIDGLGDLSAVPPIDQNLLVVGVRLMEHNGSRKQVVDGSPDTETGIIRSPIVETPVFEDITINLIIARPVIMYAEEGATE